MKTPGRPRTSTPRNQDNGDQKATRSQLKKVRACLNVFGQDSKLADQVPVLRSVPFEDEAAMEAPLKVVRDGSQSIHKYEPFNINGSPHQVVCFGDAPTAPLPKGSLRLNEINGGGQMWLVPLAAAGSAGQLKVAN